jgi:hypothetical protein
MPSWPEKLKRTGAVLSRQIASRRCCVRAARALLLGHRAGVAFWSVCCSVLRVWGRAQSVPARRAQFFAAVLRSLRQSCHKLVVAIGARYRRALAPAFGAALSSGLAMRLVGRAADSSAGSGPRTPSARLRAARVAGGEMPPLGAKCPAYDSTRRLSRQTRPKPTPGGHAAAAKPPFCLEAAPTPKKQPIRRAKGPNRDRCCPTRRAL